MFMCMVQCMHGLESKRVHAHMERVGGPPRMWGKGASCMHACTHAPLGSVACRVPCALHVCMLLPMLCGETSQQCETMTAASTMLLPMSQGGWMAYPFAPLHMLGPSACCLHCLPLRLHHQPYVTKYFTKSPLWNPP